MPKWLKLAKVKKWKYPLKFDIIKSKYIGGDEMKKIFTLLLAIALMLGVLVGCGSEEERIIGNPNQVRNDTTGKWYKATTSKNISDDDILEYAKEHIEEGQVHYIINFNTNTTIRINYYGDEYFITVTEYEKKEEHDAKTIGGGMVLKEYELK